MPKLVRIVCALAIAVVGVTAAAPVKAQTGTITGTVTDSGTGQPISAVQVRVAGTTLGGATTEAGRFNIVGVPVGTHTLEIRRVGFVPAERAGIEVTAGSATTVNVALRQSVLRLTNVVVTGVVDPTAGVKAPFTVASVSGEELQVPAPNAVASIQGKIAGAQIMQSPTPGGGVDIMLRTPTSINRGNSPLIVVDGIVQAAGIQDISSLDIESVEVVKGAAGASLYGSRAASGVIAITTARGGNVAVGRTRVSVRTEYGTNSIPNQVEWSRYHPYRLNAAGEYITAVGDTVVPRSRRVLKNPAFQDVEYPTVCHQGPAGSGLELCGRTFDHIGAFFDPGSFATTSVSVAQNAPSTNFQFSLGRNTQSGVVLGLGGYRRHDGRINLTHRLRDNLSVDFSGYHMQSNSENTYGNVFFDLLQMAPDVPLTLPDEDGTPFSFQPDPEGVRPNPLYLLQSQENESSRSRTQGGLRASFSPLSWLTIAGDASLDRSDRNGRSYTPRGSKAVGGSSIGSLNRTDAVQQAINASLTASVIGQFGPLNARGSVRGLVEREFQESFNGGASDFLVLDVPDLDVGRTFNVGSSSTDIRSQGFFVTTGFDYASKYILEGLIRRDGSSLFGPEERWNTYHRVSAAYRMAEEEWWPLADITEFKLRASEGTAGNRPGFEDQFETYSVTAAGISRQVQGNEFLKPEKSRERELGVDVIVRDRYSLQLNYVNTRTTDQLLLVPLSSAYGYTGQWRNAGTLKGNAFEATLEAQVLQTKDHTWTLGLVADRSRHKITEFNLPCQPFDDIGYLCAGETLGIMYGSVFIKDPSQLHPNQQPFADQFDVNDDGLLVPVGPDGTFRDLQKWGTNVTIGGRSFRWGIPVLLQDAAGSTAQTRIGNSNPDFRWGVSSSWRWKTFTLYGLLDSQVGGNVYNATKQRMYQNQRVRENDQDGKPDELKKPVPYYVELYNGNNTVDWFVEDGSYLKLRELSVRARAPSSWMAPLRSFGATGLSAALIGRNVFTWSDYSGYDPDVGSPLNRFDSFDYPQYRTITGSIEIVF